MKRDKTTHAMRRNNLSLRQLLDGWYFKYRTKAGRAREYRRSTRPCEKYGVDFSYKFLRTTWQDIQDFKEACHG
jgi:hypothetical protein